MVAVIRERPAPSPKEKAHATPGAPASVDRAQAIDAMEAARAPATALAGAASVSGARAPRDAQVGRPSPVVTRGLTPSQTTISRANQRLVDAQSDPLLSPESRQQVQQALLNALGRGDPGVAEALRVRARTPPPGGGNWYGAGPARVLDDAARLGIASAVHQRAHLHTEQALADAHRGDARAAPQLAGLLQGEQAGDARAVLGAALIERGDAHALAALAASGTAADLDLVAAGMGHPQAGARAAQALRELGRDGLHAAARALGADDAPGSMRARELLLSAASIEAVTAGDQVITDGVVAAARVPGAIVPHQLFDALEHTAATSGAAGDAAITALAQLAASTHVGPSAGSALAALGGRGRDAALAAWPGITDPVARQHLLRAIAPGFATDARAEAAVLEGARATDTALAQSALTALGHAMAGPAGVDPDRRRRVTEALLEIGARDPGVRAALAAAMTATLSAADVDERASAYARASAASPALAAHIARSAGASSAHAAFERSALGGDPGGVADGFIHASRGDLALVAARIAPRTLNDLVDGVRRWDPARADVVLDALYARHPALLQAQLTRDAERGDAATLARFAQRHIPLQRDRGADRAMQALAATRSSTGAQALLARAAHAEPTVTAAIAQALKTHGDASEVDAAATAALHGGASPASDAAAHVAHVAGSAAGRQVAADYHRRALVARTEKLEQQIQRSDAELQQAVNDLPVLEWLAKKGVKRQDAIQNDIATKKARVEALVQEREALAREVTARLADPSARASLAQSEAGLDATVRASVALKSTEAGRVFARDVLAPALAKDVVDDPLWKKIVKPERTGAQERAIVLVESFGIGLAATGAVGFAKAMQHALGLKGLEATGTLRELLDHGKPERVPGLLGKLAKTTEIPRTRLERFATSAGAALSIARAIDNPSAQNIITGGNDVLNAVASFTATTSKAFVVLNFVTAPVDIYNGVDGAVDALQRGDDADAAGKVTKAVGGATTLVGAGLTASVVGAPVGIPLMVIGGVVTTAGSLISAIFGDSEHEKVARALGYM